MALPTTIASVKFAARNYYHGPFLSSGGNVYVAVMESAASSKPLIYKATDPTVSFTVQDSANGPTQSASGSFWTIQSGDALYIVAGSNISTPAYKIHKFSMATDTWDSTIKDKAIASPTLNSSSAVSISVVKRSDGSLIAIFNSQLELLMGTNRERVSYAKSSDDGSTWGSPVAIGQTGIKRSVFGSVSALGASDRTHFFYTGSSAAADADHKSLSSADALDTEAVISTLGVAGVDFCHGIAYVSGGNTVVKVAFQNSSTKLTQARFNSGANPTISTDADFTDATIATINAACGTVDGTTVHYLWADSATLDLFRDLQADGGSFGTDTTVLSGVTINRVSSNVYTRSGSVVLAYLYDDGGTVKYDEIVLSSGATLISASDSLPAALGDAATHTLFQSLSETVGLPISEATIHALTQVVAETFGITASEAAVILAILSVQLDTLPTSLGEAASVLQLETRSPSDSLATPTTESLQLTVAQALAETYGIQVSEALSTIQAVQTVAEATVLGLAETPLTLAILTLADLLGLGWTETVAVALKLPTLTDSFAITLAEAVQLIQSATVAVADSLAVTLNEALTPALAVLQTVTDISPLALSDATRLQVAHALIETLPIVTDEQLRSAMATTLTEMFGLGSTEIAAVFAVLDRVADSLAVGLGDLASVVTQGVDVVQTVSDTLAMTETEQTRLTIGFAALMDSLGLRISEAPQLVVLLAPTDLAAVQMTEALATLGLSFVAPETVIVTAQELLAVLLRMTAGDALVVRWTDGAPQIVQFGETTELPPVLIATLHALVPAQTLVAPGFPLTLTDPPMAYTLELA